MNCHEVQKLLSAYYDGELPDEFRSAVAEHLAGCSTCAQELAGFKKLSVMAHGLRTPEPPAHIWSRIEAQLAGDAAIAPQSKHAKRYGTYAAVAAIAAAVLIAVSIGIYQTWFRHDVSSGHNEMVADFHQYLDRFPDDPDAAQRFLLAKYQSEPADIEQAARQLGYLPVVVTGMPAGFSRGEVYVMDMPCCKCVQCTCKRDDGRTLAIFEHDEKEPGWFGDRPVTTARCGDRECRIVQLNDGLAASWQQGDRQLTVVGASNMQEVEELVRWFSQTVASAEPG